MTAVPDQNGPALDRPWKRPGAARYALTRLRGLLKSPAEVYEPAPDAIVVQRDSEVTTRDGTILRVNVHLPATGGVFPVILCAHPYAKDNLPKRKKHGGGYSVPFQYRVLRQTAPVRFSKLTGWEAPDPAWWTAQGFAVANCDLRGCGHSDGTGSLLSDQEGEDVYDLIEWAAAQPWSTGAVGTLGVSYLAISQWKAASLRPPHLKAIVPWEGFTDAYRELLRPGGIQEIGFVKLWGRGTSKDRLKYQLGEENTNRPMVDDWWRSLVPDLPKIEVPALICGSFSDNNLHSRGSIRGFEQISSAERHLYTHRDGKWANFYSEQSRSAQLAFLDRHLRGGSAAELPRVRLEVRESRDQIVEVRAENSWPLESTQWTPLYLTGAGLSAGPAAKPGSISFDTRRAGVRFGWTVPEDTELTGPMALRLFVDVAGSDDVDLFVGVEKWRGGRYVPFEGSYGFGRDRVTTGWLRASLRALDQSSSRPFEPVPAYTAQDKLSPGQIVDVDIPLGPSATVFRAGEQLRLVIAGRWLWPRNPLTGQFPGAYRSTSAGTATVHWGPEHGARLLVPMIPR
ncbi:CocE/NonD family hydrolase [soil metagenome]